MAATKCRVFIDIETTGLDPHVDLILEVGVVVVDDSLRTIAHHAVLIASPEALEWAATTLDRWQQFTAGDFNRYAKPAVAQADEAGLDMAAAMHLDNGLIWHLTHPGEFTTAPDGLVDLDRTVAASYAEAAATIGKFLDESGIIEPVPMAGSSVRSLDGPFLEVHMPLLFSRFTHRTIDASALTELVRFIDPRGCAAIMADIDSPGHRTVEDCLRSIDIVADFTARYGIGERSALVEGTGNEHARHQLQ